MTDVFRWLIDDSGFTPRANCGNGWTDGLRWLHAGSDLLIGLAYVAIPLTLLFFLRKRAMPFSFLIALFGAFILACGTGHLIESVMFQHPVYHLSGVIKAFTAAVSWLTVVALIPAAPRVVSAVDAFTARTPTAGDSADWGFDPQPARGYVAAVLASVLAVVVRAGLDPFLDGDQAFVIPLLAVVAVAWYAGLGPALVALFLSMTAVLFLFVEPRQSLVAAHFPDQLAVGLFLFAGVGCAALGEAQKQSRQKAAATLESVMLKQAELEAEVARRERAEAEQRRAAALLAAVTDTAPDLIFAKDRDGRMLMANPATLAVIGRPAAEVIGHNESEWVNDPAQAAAIRTNDQRVMATGNTELVEEVFTGPAGRRVFLSSKAPMRDAAGEVVGVIGVTRDITDRADAEVALRTSEARFRAMADSIDQLAWMTRPDGHIYWYNQRWYDYTGTTLADMQGWGWESVHDPAELPRVAAKWRAALAAGEPWEDTFPLRRQDGAMRWHLSRARPVRDDAGAIVSWFGTNTDIDDRKRAEEAQAERVNLAALRADVGVTLGGDDPTPAVLQRCAEAVVRHLDAAFARVWTLNDAEQVLELRASAGLYTHTDGPHARVPVGKFKIGRIAESKTPHLTNDVQADPNVSDQAWAKREGMVAFAGYPLLLGDRVVGVAALFARRPLSPAVLADLGPLFEGVAQYVERKRAEAAVRASEARFRDLADAMPQIVFAARPDGHVDYFNRRWYEYTGFPADGPTGDAGWVAVHEPDRFAEVADVWGRALRTGEPYQNEYRLRRADGAWRWHLGRALPIRDAAGGIVRWYGTNTDIDDQKRAEAELTRSLERFRLLTEAIPQIVWNADASGKVTYFNTRWSEYTGELALDAAARGWLAAVHPDDIAGVDAAWQDTVTRADRPFTQELRLRRADGAVRWFLTVAVPLHRYDGTVDQWIGSMADIHDQKEHAATLEKQVADRTAALLAEVEERKKAEEAAGKQRRFLDVILENVADGIVACDEGGTLTLFNRATREFHGLPAEPLPPDQWAGRYALYRGDGVTPLPRDEIPLFRALRGEVVREAEMVIAPRDGSPKTLLANGQRLTDPAGESLGAVVSMRDITERKRADEQFRRFAEELQRSNGELEKFAYVASHDLQEPLRKIQAFGDRLGSRFKDKLDDQGRDYLDRMQSSAARMRQLINDLLAFSRVTTKTQPFCRVDLNKVAADAVDDLHDRLQHTGGAVDVGPLPTIDADPTQARQLLQNLIGNGLKFHKPGEPPRVTVRAEAVPGPDPAVRLTVSDNGIGFEEKYLDRIFQVFQRLHGRGEYDGTGVGLAICRKIVDRHGGAITARSAPDRGATFVVTMPLRHPTRAATS